MVRLVDLHQPGCAECVAEAEETAEGIRPTFRHALDRARPGEAHCQHEGQLDAGERVVRHAKAAGSEGGNRHAAVVGGRGERLAHGGSEHDGRLPVEEILVARTFADGQHLGNRRDAIAL